MSFSSKRVLDYVSSLHRPSAGGFASVPDGEETLYGTCYALLTQHYLGQDLPSNSDTTDFVLRCQDEDSGYFVGPELANWSPPSDAKHDREHLLMHLTCTTLPVCREIRRLPKYELRFARRFCDPDYIREWLDQRDMRDAWFEGNNLLFVGQLLIYLRDAERSVAPETGLNAWFDWLDARVDSATGLWGTDGACSPFVAMCGGYHQLLAYYHERRPVQHRERLIDTVLRLQHEDGGFSPHGGGGACEDVDAVDILVNMYKQVEYRRAEIRLALRRCLRHILSLQNSDGGFPYKRNAQQNHMSIPATAAGPNVSCMFPTWFRVHTLALIAQILTDEPVLYRNPFRFSSALSMGWHRSWDLRQHRLTKFARAMELAVVAARAGPRRVRSLSSRVKRRLFRAVAR